MRVPTILREKSRAWTTQLKSTTPSTTVALEKPPHIHGRKHQIVQNLPRIVLLKYHQKALQIILIIIIIIIIIKDFTKRVQFSLILFRASSFQSAQLK